MKEKIGVGIITYNREEYFTRVYNSIKDCQIDDLVIVNDGTPYKFIPDKGNLIQNEENKGVAISKNKAIDYLMKKECKHIFLIEDDILVKNCEVFNEYIRVAKKTGLYHLNFEQVGLNEKRFGFTYDADTSISCYKNPQGAFQYTLANIFRELGTFNEGYKNAFEHIEFILRLSRHELLPPFWYFPDISNSTDYLEPIEGSIENSTITNKEKYHENWNESAKHFILTHGFFTSDIKDPGQNVALSKLMKIQKTYGKKDEIITDNKLIQSTQTA